MKKQGSAIQGNDKRLLIILLALIIGFVCYYFVIDPQLTKGSELKAQKEQVERELQEAKNTIAGLPGLEAQEKETKETLAAKYKTFFYDLNEERILMKLNTLMNESDLPVTAYRPSAPVVSSINVPVNTYTEIEYPLLDIAAKTNETLRKNEENAQPETNQEAKVSDGSDTIPTVDILIEIKGASYASVMSFIQKAEDMQKTVLIKSIEMNKAETLINGTIVLSIYSLPKLDESETDDLEFLPVVPKGKVDPFM